MGVPQIIQFSRIFPNKNHPAMGVAPCMEPPHIFLRRKSSKFPWKLWLPMAFGDRETQDAAEQRDADGFEILWHGWPTTAIVVQTGSDDTNHKTMLD